MAPRTTQELIFLRLVCDRYILPEYPEISLESNHHSPFLEEWYANIVLREIGNLPINMNFKCCTWQIASSDETLFSVNGICYDNVLVLLGEEKAHWLFLKTLSPELLLHGSAELPISYCSCCMNWQYIKIMDAVKSFASIKQESE